MDGREPVVDGINDGGWSKTGAGHVNGAFWRKWAVCGGRCLCKKLIGSCKC